MPEYLHPGVYIEETSFRAKPIEGVSTSTAGLVGATRTGPEGKPTLVTSFAQFVREFGQPYSIASGAPAGLGHYLGHAVRAFFENGGRRAYIVRALPGDALASQQTLTRGTVLHVPANRALRVGDTAIPVLSLRGVEGPFPVTLRLYTRPDANSAFANQTIQVTGINAARNELTVAALTATVLGGATSVNASNAYIAFSTTDLSGAGPTFRARSRGIGGDNLSVQVRPADRPPVSISAGTPSGAPLTLTVASTSSFYQGAIVEVDHGSGTKDYRVVDSVDPAARTVRLDAALSAAVTANAYARTLEIDVLVYENGVVRESFTGLSWNSDPDAASFNRYYVERINDAANGSRLVTITTPAPSLTPAPDQQPSTVTGHPVALAGGSDGSPLTAGALVGTDDGPGRRTGIEALRERDDISLVAVPGVTDEQVQQALITHCELLKYRFAILDGAPNVSDVNTIRAHRNNYDTKYAGYYAPWLKTVDLATGRTFSVPPSGHVLGICARTDNERGVHKAPANEVVRSIVDVELPFGDGEQDVLNPVGVNLIREFEGRGIRVWGGRTLSSDAEWKYVNVRRLFIFLEHSIDRGTQWVVFEPNTEALWQRVVETIESFLFGVWKSGALMGTSPEQAFFVRCDRTTMTQDDIDNGRLVCLIGVAPAYPAEFVIFRIGQFTATSNRA